MKKTTYFIILLLWLVVSLIILYSVSSTKLVGTLSCGGNGGDSILTVQSSTVKVQNSVVSLQAGNGGDCNFSLSSDKDQERNYFLSLLSSIFAVMANALFIYDYFTSKKIPKAQ